MRSPTPVGVAAAQSLCLAGRLADATLGRRKDVVAGGVPQLWRQGRVLEVLDRNWSDVELNRDLFEFGRDLGYVVARAKDGIGFEQLEVSRP